VLVDVPFVQGGTGRFQWSIRDTPELALTDMTRVWTDKATPPTKRRETYRALHYSTRRRYPGSFINGTGRAVFLLPDTVFLDHDLRVTPRVSLTSRGLRAKPDSAFAWISSLPGFEDDDKDVAAWHMHAELKNGSLRVTPWGLAPPPLRMIEVAYQEKAWVGYVLYYVAVFLLGIAFSEGGLWIFRRAIGETAEGGARLWAFRREYYVPVAGGVLLAVILVGWAHDREFAKQPPNVVHIGRIALFDVPMREGPDSRERWNTPWPSVGQPVLGIVGEKYADNVPGVFSSTARDRALFAVCVDSILGQRLTIKPQVNVGSDETPAMRWADTDVAPAFAFSRGGEHAWRMQCRYSPEGELVTTRWDE
jgi:hypothetical protein